MDYAVAIHVFMDNRKGKIVNVSMPIIIYNAHSKDEAIGSGLRVAFKRFPVKDGWQGHTASAVAFGTPPLSIDNIEVFKP